MLQILPRPPTPTRTIWERKVFLFFFFSKQKSSNTKVINSHSFLSWLCKQTCYHKYFSTLSVKFRFHLLSIPTHILHQCYRALHCISRSSCLSLASKTGIYLVFHISKRIRSDCVFLLFFLFKNIQFLHQQILQLQMHFHSQWTNFASFMCCLSYVVQLGCFFLLPTHRSIMVFMREVYKLNAIFN